MKIYMNVGADKYMALDKAGAFKVVSKDHALKFQHAYDMCMFINKNRKRINAFLREHSLHLVLKTEMNTEDEETGRVHLEENDDNVSKGFCFETVDRGNECSVKTDMALAS